MIADINNIYIYYSLFIPFKINTLLPKIYLNFISLIKITIIVNDNFDYYKYTNNSSKFCKSYYSMIVEKIPLKFESANYINILLYQKYFDVFSDLIPIKKTFITCAYLSKFVIKLRASKTDLTALYY